MADLMVSLLGGALYELFHQRKTGLFRVFLISTCIFSCVALCLVITSEFSYFELLMSVIAFGVFGGLVMAVSLHWSSLKSNNHKIDANSKEDSL